MQKKNFFKSPLIIASIICFAIAIVLSLSVRGHEDSTVKGVHQKNISTPKRSVQVITTSAPTKGVSAIDVVTSPILVESTPAHPVSSQNDAASPQYPPTSVPQQAVKTFQVGLSINGSSVGSVEVGQGANQCDVLTKAKEQGKIASLLMKYDNSLGTNAVYQINGQGKENTVWWVYKVNGQSPMQGCSYVKANSGESVEWEYKG